MAAEITTQVCIQAEIQLHRRISEAHEAFARALEPLAEEQAEEGVPALRGATKRRVIALPGMYTERGLSAGDRRGARSGCVQPLPRSRLTHQGGLCGTGRGCLAETLADDDQAPPQPHSPSEPPHP
jgi:hypothetical protein